MKDLRATLIQADLYWEDKAANLSAFTAKLNRLDAGETDLVLLPEMFTTGFTMNAAPLAEPADGPTVEWMAEQAARLDAVVCGSFIALEAGRFYNRLVWMQPDGRYRTYDKRHLFTLAGEHHTYTPGQQRLLVEWRGWKVLPLICYDLRFPAWSRNLEGYDLLIYVANWPSPRRHHWRSLLAGRAIENQAYTLGVNRVGLDGNGYPHTGDTSAIDFAGEELLHLAQAEGCVTLTLSHQEQQAFRQKLPFLADRDTFSFE
jgi:omega-amidase